MANPKRKSTRTQAPTSTQTKMRAKSRPSKRLKVYMTQIGFHTWLVAAPSQKAALAAWDVKENLFAMGSAEVVTDKACIELAMKTPGVPTPVDAAHAFAKASKVLRLDDHRRSKPAAKASAPKATKPPKRRKADRSKLDKAEAAFDAFSRRAVRERAAIVRAQKALDLKAEALEDELDAEKAELKGALEAARKAYEAEL
jgi:hypothetical protein